MDKRIETLSPQSNSKNTVRDGHQYFNIGFKSYTPYFHRKNILQSQIKFISQVIDPQSLQKSSEEASSQERKFFKILSSPSKFPKALASFDTFIRVIITSYKSTRKYWAECKKHRQEFIIIWIICICTSMFLFNPKTEYCISSLTQLQLLGPTSIPYSFSYHLHVAQVFAIILLTMLYCRFSSILLELSFVFLTKLI